jgi:capsular exopolysaccharide synthesis family protein
MKSPFTTIDIRDYFGFLFRRKWLIVTIMMVMAVLALIYTSTLPKIYKANVLLQINNQATMIFDKDGRTVSNIGAGEFYKTQYRLLTSRSLAQRVIEQTGLEQELLKAGEQNPLKEFYTKLKSRLMGDGPSESSSSADQAETTEDAPMSADALEARDQMLVNIFLSKLKVEPEKYSALVRVYFSDTNNKLAARVVNALAQNFIDQSLDRRLGAANYTKGYIEGRIEKIKAELLDAEEKLVEYAKEHSIIRYDDRQSVVMDRLTRYSQAQADAEVVLEKSRAAYTQFEESGGDIHAVALSNEVIRDLKKQLATLEAKYQEQLTIYKPGYPAMKRLRQQIQESQVQIDKEAERTGGSLKARYEQSLKEVELLKGNMAELTTDLLELQTTNIQYNTLQRELDNKKKVFDALIEKYSKLNIVDELGANNIFIVDHAAIPRGHSEPSMRKNVMLGALIGLFLGVVIAFVLESLDDSIKDVEDFEHIAGFPVLGTVPLEKLADARDSKDKETDTRLVAMFSHTEPQSALAESFRSMRTALMFSTSAGAPQCLMATSSMPSEGKSTIVINMAITFSQKSNSNVLLIDADLRNPSLHRYLDLDNNNGLSDYLTSAKNLTDVTQPTEVPGVFAISAGLVPPDPVELLSSPKMLELLAEVRERFDYIIIDTPPVIGLADALVVSDIVDATIIIANQGKTRKRQLLQALTLLRRAQAHLLGGVLNKVETKNSKYGYGYYYGHEYGKVNRQIEQAPAVAKKLRAV